MTNPIPSDADELICAALRAERPAWPWGGNPAAVTMLFERIELHGIQALLHAALGETDWPPEVIKELRDQSVQRAMWELRHQQVLAQTLAALEVIGVQPVLIKGTALAYSLYANPVLRTRGDTDLVIPLIAKQQVDRTLCTAGYERSLGVSGEFISYQANYTIGGSDGSSHTLDLHWKINNSELLSRLFTYDELRQDAQALPELSTQALGASRVHALLLACMHRSTHKQNPYYVDGHAHHDANRLIWLYDIHLLAGAMFSQEWEQFAHMAGTKGLRAVCLEGMQQAATKFNTQYPASVILSLARKDKPEPPAQYLDGNKLRQQWMDFRAIDNAMNQLRFTRELIFPPAQYMRIKYPDHASAWLPWLYLRRADAGMTRRMMEGRSTS